MKKKILSLGAAMALILCSGCGSSSNNRNGNYYYNSSSSSRYSEPKNPIPENYTEYWNKLYTRSLDWAALRKKVLDEGAQKVTYQQLARDTNGLFNENIIISEQIIQIVDLDDETWYEGLINVTYKDYYYDDSVYFIVPKAYVSQRILEGDLITFTGKSAGLYTYENVMGASRTVPCITAVKVEFN